ncbi:FmdB family zinc ribbon protein [Anaeromyxobacter oryzae]|uniref:Putative regulatory protein FmdB zinc ribbon domain-containing protein n=1 Tax=Anaeromyxobacter oryzae TaxID=2918170 RepID=A0ABM7X3N1_9BACT|nr:zinc ribbon domain-containing protein [Anaeromyxobacter oryzae]BDG06412.1 hypothetical protein AMOR_54080 [Anaeromyxobacter oryzae]
MPIYEYVCEECGRLTEVMQRMTDPAPEKCPECGAPRLARLVSRTSFQLKGGGWYSDLYASPKKKTEAGSGSAPASSSSASGGAAPGGTSTASPGASGSGSGGGGGTKT